MIILTPGQTPLSVWQQVYRGADARVDARADTRVGLSAAAIAEIVRQEEPVYGINTGFGKLATVRINASDLARLQENIVRSHSVGVGEPLGRAETRLMMALKIASLAQGASGVHRQTIRQL
jgi:histidine ammonia-lyase